MRDMVLGHRTRRARSRDTRQDQKLIINKRFFFFFKKKKKSKATDFPRKSLFSMTASIFFQLMFNSVLFELRLVGTFGDLHRNIVYLVMYPPRRLGG